MVLLKISVGVGANLGIGAMPNKVGDTIKLRIARDGITNPPVRVAGRVEGEGAFDERVIVLFIRGLGTKGVRVDRGE